MAQNESGAGIDAQAQYEDAIEAQMREQERRGRRPSRARAQLELDAKAPHLRQALLREANG